MLVMYILSSETCDIVISQVKELRKMTRNTPESKFWIIITSISDMSSFTKTQKLQVDQHVQQGKRIHIYNLLPN